MVVFHTHQASFCSQSHRPLLAIRENAGQSILQRFSFPLQRLRPSFSVIGGSVSRVLEEPVLTLHLIISC